MIAVIDYDTGNIRNLIKALDYVGRESQLTADPAEILAADGLILPGVGAFAKAMEALDQRNLIPVIQQAVRRQIPLLGICLGMQLLFERSEEFGDHAGLGLLPGRIKAIPATAELKVPEMGWNQNRVFDKASQFAQSVTGQYTYFVHSYYADCPQTNITVGGEYGVLLPSIVQQDNVVVKQFQLVKSSTVGLKYRHD